MKLKHLISTFLAAAIVLPVTAFAAGGGGAPLQSANINLHDKESLQRGAKYYVNYCQSCHELGFSRYNRVAQDTGLSDEQVAANLIFTRDEKGDPTKVGSLMTNAMDTDAAGDWFGTAPPDLSLVARSRGGPDWLFTYLNSFYADPSRPFGVNNTTFPSVGMPHVLADLQGVQELVPSEDKNALPKFNLVEAGSMDETEYKKVTRDITNFLTYVGEPAGLHRKEYGIWVLLFLAVFFVFAYLLKKEYWKDVH